MIVERVVQVFIFNIIGFSNGNIFVALKRAVLLSKSIRTDLLGSYL